MMLVRILLILIRVSTGTNLDKTATVDIRVA